MSGREAVSRRVLVAEDDEGLRGLLSAIMSYEGFEVTECSDGVELLSHLAGQLLGEEEPGYALIVADVLMPGLTGLEVVEGLRDCGLVTPAILLTAFGDPALVLRARSLDGVVVLEKPFVLEELRHEVRSRSVQDRAAA